MLRNTQQRWGVMAQGLHWLSMAIVIGLFGVGLYMVALKEGAASGALPIGTGPDAPLIFGLIHWHKSFGMLVLALSLLRLGWRLAGPAPADSDRSKAWEISAARLAHVALYGLLFVMPLTGWILASASTLGVKTVIFGVWELPHLVAPDEALHGLLVEVHKILAWSFMALVAFHVGGALKHHVIYKDDVLTRMLPWSKG